MRFSRMKWVSDSLKVDRMADGACCLSRRECSVADGGSDRETVDNENK